MSQKVIAPFTILLITHWSKVLSEFFYKVIKVNPSAFQNGITLENQVKIEGAMSKNIAVKLHRP